MPWEEVGLAIASGLVVSGINRVINFFVGYCSDNAAVNTAITEIDVSSSSGTSEGSSSS